jgi:hypothetical protein
MKSKVQNERNIRVSIPSKIAKFLVDLAEREFNTELFTKICVVITGVLQTDSVNSTRVIAAILRQKTLSKSYKTIVYQEIIDKYMQSLV